MWVLVALFLPLFPLSVVQNMLLARIPRPLARSALLLLLPQVGVTLLHTLHPPIPGFLVTWALLSSAFYALRLLTVRDLELWSGLFVSSALALTWGVAARGADVTTLRLFAFWFSLPATLLVLLTASLARRMGAAYAGLFTGLAQSQPRLAGVLTLVVLSIIATPPFPGFFALLDILHGFGGAAALSVLGVWLIWGWAATRVLQGFNSSNGREISGGDLGMSSVVGYAVTLVVFAAAGFLFTRGGL